MADGPATTKPHDATPAWQSLVTLLLVIHLFALAAAAASSARIVSPLVNRLFANVPGVQPYTEGLNLRYFSFPLTYGSDGDWNHNCDVLLNWQPNASDADDEPPGFERLPLYGPEHAKPHLRLLRYQMLAMQVRERSQDENNQRSALLPRGVVRGLLAEHGVTDGNHRFRCRSEAVPAPPYIDEQPPTPQNQTVARYDVAFFNNRAELTRIETLQQSAPVRGNDETTKIKPNPGNGGKP